MAHQATPVPSMEPLPQGEGFLRAVAQDLGAFYRSDVLLKVQAVLSIVAIAICSFLTPNASSTVTGLLLTEGTITLLLYSSLIMAIFYVPQLNKDLIWALRRAVRIRYHIILFCLRAAGIILVLRALSLFWERPREGRQHQRLRYRRVLHIITMCKLMNLPDVLSVADSLLAVAVMISAKLELATKFTNPVRICATYVSMLVLVMFRSAKVPFEKVSAAESKGLPPPNYPFGMVDGCTHALLVISTKRQTDLSIN